MVLATTERRLAALRIQEPTTMDLVIAKRRPAIEQAVQLAASGFAVEHSEMLSDDVRRHLEKGDVCYTLGDARLDYAFAIFERFPVREGFNILYLAGIHVSPMLQGAGICERLVGHARTPDDRVFVLRTQSPVMWASGRRICNGQWYPSPDVSGVGTLPYELGRLLAPSIEATAYPISPRHYRMNLYGKPPRHRDPTTQTWWESICNAARGDAVICAGVLG